MEQALTKEDASTDAPRPVASKVAAGGMWAPTLLVTAVGLISAGLGFVNQLVIAKYFGTSAQLDAFLIASAIPSLFGGVGMAIFSSTVIPALAPVGDEPNQIGEAIAALTGWTILGAFVLVVIAELARGVILRSTTALGGGTLDLAIRLSTYIWPITGLSIVCAFCGSLHNLKKRFLLASTLGPLQSVGMIVGTLVLGRRFGIEGLVIGWLGMTITALVLLSPILKQFDVSIRTLRLRNRHALACAGTMPSVALGLMPYTILPTLDAMWASRLPAGSMSYIGYCTRFSVALAALLVNGIYVVILPYLSDDVSNKAHERFSVRIRRSVEYVLLATIPIVCFAILFRRELTIAFFQRGAFHEGSAAAVASLLPFYLVGMIFMAPSTIISRGYLAAKLHKTYALFSLGMTLAYFALAGTLSARFSFYGIGAAYALYWIAFFFLGMSWLDTKLASAQFFARLAKVGLSAMLSGIVVRWALCWSCQGPRLLSLVLEGTAFIVLFVGLAWSLKAIDTSEFERIGLWRRWQGLVERHRMLH